MPRPERRKVYAISPPIIDCTNSPGSERRFQPLRTIAFYSSVTSNRVGEIVGLVRFVPSRVEEWLHFLSLAPGSKAKLKCVLSTLYHHAIRYEWLTFNPISRVRTSQMRLRDKDVLTPEEFQKLVQQLCVRDRAMVLPIGSTGLRRSEMIALTWSDLNMRTMEVNVLRSCVRNRIGKTKTDASRGPVPFRPRSLAPLSLAPRSLAPRSLAPRSLAPRSLAPRCPQCFVG